MIAGRKRARQPDGSVPRGVAPPARDGRGSEPPRKRARSVTPAGAGASRATRTSGDGGSRRPRPAAPRAEVEEDDDGAGIAASDDAGSDAGGDASAGNDSAGGLRGFGVAFAKIMAREVTGGADPVLAKRHTAGAKLAAASVREHRDAKRRTEVRLAAKRAHLVDPTAYGAERELNLQRIATKGGTSPCAVRCASWRRAAVHHAPLPPPAPRTQSSPCSTPLPSIRRRWKRHREWPLPARQRRAGHKRCVRWRHREAAAAAKPRAIAASWSC